MTLADKLARIPRGRQFEQAIVDHHDEIRTQLSPLLAELESSPSLSRAQRIASEIRKLTSGWN